MLHNISPPHAAAIASNTTISPPASYVYTPNYCHYFYENLGRNRERNLGHIVNVTFNKREDHTALRITWEGNFRKQRCVVCCAEWYITINGARCTEDVKTSIVSRTSYNIFFPTTLSGICHEVGGVPLTKGLKLLKLEVGNCEGSAIADGGAGFSQSSRFIVEEIPRGAANTVYIVYAWIIFGTIWGHGTNLFILNLACYSSVISEFLPVYSSAYADDRRYKNGTEKLI